MIVNGLFNLPNNLSSFIPHFMANRTEAKVQCVSPRGRMGAPVPLGKSFSSPFSWWEHGPLSIGEKVALCDTVAWAAGGNASIPYLTLFSCPSKHLLRVAQDWGLCCCCGSSGEFWVPCHSAFQIFEKGFLFHLWRRLSLEKDFFFLTFSSFTFYVFSVYLMSSFWSIWFPEVWICYTYIETFFGGI